jgi:hypothetical protein
MNGTWSARIAQTDNPATWLAGKKRTLRLHQPNRFDAVDTDVVLMDQRSLLIGIAFTSPTSERGHVGAIFVNRVWSTASLLCPSISEAHVQALALYDATKHRPLADRFGQDSQPRADP